MLARTSLKDKRWHIEHEVKANITFCDQRSMDDMRHWSLLDHLADDVDSLNLCQKCRDAWEAWESDDDDDDLMAVANQHMASIMRPRTVPDNHDDFGDWLLAS